ncbi:MAG: hypothetical protein DRI97_09150 [Bacteroidetes bacterium]|nr:MAG: hypothetical protein DRI97_09150 [Bacteroidota bacterium]
MFEKNPVLPADNWYDGAKEFNFICDLYKRGEGLRMDVDRDNGALINYTSNETLEAFLRMNPNFKIDFAT